MAGEAILIVDDTPVNLKLTRVILLNEGYRVSTASSAEEALEVVRTNRPQLVLADIRLPGMSGLDLARHLKHNPGTRDIVVVALTAFAMKGDEQKAIDAGCDGYITKPIDTRALGAHIRECLDRRSSNVPEPLNRGPDPPPVVRVSMSNDEMHALKTQFQEEGLRHIRGWMLDLEETFNANDAADKVHQWIGSAGLLGYRDIVRLSREVETILHERPLDQTQLRDSLRELGAAFTTPQESHDTPLPETIVRALSGRRVALVGLPPNEARRLAEALQRAHATPVGLQVSDRPDLGDAGTCEGVVVHVRGNMAGCRWLDRAAMGENPRPLLLVGSREHIMALDPAVLSLAREFLVDSWDPEEALLRLSLAFGEDRRTLAKPGPVSRPRVLIADDDNTVVSLVAAALQNFGMECHTASDGRNAMETVRRLRPHVAVLDVNMPGMDGFAVLAAIRSEDLPIRVLLLTARQREADVIRGFSLGADDYVVKPFSPMELVARLKRLLCR